MKIISFASLALLQSGQNELLSVLVSESHKVCDAVLKSGKSR